MPAWDDRTRDPGSPREYPLPSPDRGNALDAELRDIARRATALGERASPGLPSEISSGISKLSASEDFDVQAWWRSASSAHGLSETERRLLDAVRDLGLEAVATRVLGGRSEKIGEGGSAVVFRRGDEVLIFPKYGEKEAIENHIKQAWCASRACEAGVSTPIVTEISSRAPYYAIADFQPGESARDLISAGRLSSEDAYRLLGEAARRINSVPLAAFGVPGPLTQRGVNGAGASWIETVDSMIEETRAGGAALGSGSRVNEIVERLEAAKEWAVTPVLCHMDLVPANMLLSDRGPAIIDWEKAVSGSGLRHELSALLSQEPWPSRSELRAFGEGYGIDPATLEGELDAAKTLLLPRCLSLASSCKSAGNDEWAGRWLSKLRDVLGGG